MKSIIKLGIIGDYNPDYQSHIATDNSLKHAAEALSINIDSSWLSTPYIEKEFNDSTFEQYNALWCAPGSPYKSIDGALKAIKYARENDIPYIGTCGGFQHTLLEYARNVLRINDASHEEIFPNSNTLFISKLSCSLVGKMEKIYLTPNTTAYSVYKKEYIKEQFRCNYGLNPKYTNEINNKDLVISGIGLKGEPRIIELLNNRFFVATLFLPQLSSSFSMPHPLIKRYLQAAMPIHDSKK